MGMVKVLVGGCFDLLHKGHISFLKKAKKAGDKLVVLLESDEKIKKLKGESRPVQIQEVRAKALSGLGFVDEIIKLPFMDSDKDYDELVKKIKPDIIAVTEGYPGIAHS
jgi:rfaE bifunctional protein nucleotidyltransferase chain/domain